MTEKELFQEVGRIKEEYIVEAQEYKRSVIHNPVFKRTLATAACLVLCVGIYWGNSNMHTDEGPNSISSVGQTAVNSLSGEAFLKDQMDMVHNDMNKNTVQTDSVNKTEEVPEYILNQSQEEQVTVAGAPGEGMQTNEAENKCELEATLKEDISFNLDEAKARLGNYPNTLEELRQENVYIVLHGISDTGSELWEEFLQSVNDDITADIDIVRLTDEGYPIITCVYFDGQLFHVVCDSTRDMGAGDGGGLHEETYKYLNVLQSDNRTETVLSQEADLTIAQLKSGEYETYELFQCDME